MSELLCGKTVLGLLAQVVEVPSTPYGPAVACRIRLGGKEAMVQRTGRDAGAKAWVNFGKFSVPVMRRK